MPTTARSSGVIAAAAHTRMSRAEPPFGLGRYTCTARPMTWANSTTPRIVRLRYRLTMYSMVPVTPVGFASVRYSASRNEKWLTCCPAGNFFSQKSQSAILLLCAADQLFDRDLAQQLEVAQHLAGAQHHRGQRVVGD